MKKLLFVLVIAVMVLAGCAQPAATVPAPVEPVATEPAQPPAPAVEEPAAPAPAEPEPAAATFNPDLNPDKISFEELEAKFGPVPAPAAGTTIGALEKNLANEFWIALETGYKNMAEKYGVKLDSQASRTETDLQGQLAILESMMGNNYGGYLLSPLSNENLNTAADTLKTEGKPIVNVNCEFVEVADVFVGSMQLDIGRLAGEYIGEKLGGKGKVAIIEGVPGSYTSTSRVDGFREVIESKFPGIEIVASQPADYEREKGMNVATNILNANPDLNAIYGCNDNMALGAIEALRTMGKLGEVLVIGIDGTAGAYESVQKGELTGTIDQFPMRTGEIAMEVLLRLLDGQKLPRVVSTPIEMIDSSNIEKYAQGAAMPAAEPEKPAAGEVFNPDLNPDKISFEELEAKFGPVPAPAAGTTIGALEKNLANEFWIALETGYKNMAEKYGVKLDSQASRTETDLQGQLAILESMMGNNYGGYLLSPLSNENLNTAADTLKTEGKPIVNVNCEFVEVADVFVGSMQLDIGRLAGEYIGEKLGGKGKVAIIEGVPGSYTSTSRVDGFREVIESKFPGIEIVASQPADYEREKGMNVATNILNANPDLNAIYGCNDNMALGAIEALRTMGKLGEVLVIGIDGTAGAYESVQKGELTGTIDQFPMRTGEIAMEVLLRLLDGQKLPRVVSTPIMMIDASNIAEYSQ